MENSITYFKQYGEMRTGTNYIKRLLELNFDNVCVLGSVLGWKHGMYETRNGPDSTTSHIDWLNKQHKNGRVHSVDGYPLKFNYEELKRAIPKLNYIFSIKPPFAFVVSYKKFRFPKKKLHDTVVKNLCVRYNESYAAWKEMYIKNEFRSFIVPYETLLTDMTHILFNFENTYKLNRKLPKYVDETSPVNASTDHGLLIDNKKKFNKDYYIESEYMDELSQDHVNIIWDNIDYDVVDWFYANGL